MAIEELVLRYPHVHNKETYEDIDALAGVLAFVFSDLVETHGLDPS